MRRRRGFSEAGFWFGLAGVTTLVVVLVMAATRVTVDYVTATVTSKESVARGKGHKYLIFTEGETFENTDSLAFWKFNSSDIYGRIKAGKRYRFKVRGWRVPMFSWYRNILDAEEFTGEMQWKAN